jgi:hypothetical protein
VKGISRSRGSDKVRSQRVTIPQPRNVIRSVDAGTQQRRIRCCKAPEALICHGDLHEIEPTAEEMDNVSKACLSIFAITILAVALDKTNGVRDEAALCDGRQYQLGNIRNGAAPYIGLNADGVSGQFLLDYGTTGSSLSTSGFAASDRFRKNAAHLLADVKGGNFALRHYDMPLQPAGGQVGVIGTDFLSLLSVQISGRSVFVGAQPCQPITLRARGMVPIAQRDFFSSEPSSISGTRPNVPVVFLRLGEVHTWAQIDTGYEDVVYAHSVDINEVLFQRLIKDGMALDHLADINVSTCEGRESRHVYTVKDRSLVIETDQATPIVRIEKFYLILKPVNACGGIGVMSVPAAQLGASFLRIFGTIVFDPQSGTVWLDGRDSKRG